MPSRAEERAELERLRKENEDLRRELGILDEDEDEDEEEQEIEPRRVTRASRIMMWEELLETAREHDCVVEIVVERKLATIEQFEYGDQTWIAFENWGQRNSTGRLSVSILCNSPPGKWADRPWPFPSYPIVGNAEEAEEYENILREAMTIIAHYSKYTIEDLESGTVPEVEPTTGGEHVSVFVDDKMALAPLFEALQNPPLTFSGIHGLPSGSYICEILQEWRTLNVCIAVFRK